MYPDANTTMKLSIKVDHVRTVFGNLQRSLKLSEQPDQTLYHSLVTAILQLVAGIDGHAQYVLSPCTFHEEYCSGMSITDNDQIASTANEVTAKTAVSCFKILFLVKFRLY